ncbi:sarcosine oxidase subunit gamma [Nitrincola sp. MINF-07-Sa-05]|uniref:sarcosine oxidase subunit gamma n=1 Tax=Nitrincola salilacus TaxID=3400273 RepID=UPI0039185FFF
MSKVAIIDQCAGSDIRAESPLHHVSVPSAAANPGVVLEQKPFLGHMTLRGNAADEAFCAAIQQMLGVALPVQPSALVHDASGENSIQWISPDEWLIVVPGGREFEIETALHQAYSGHFAIVTVSGGQTLLTLSGPNALDVLHKSTVYDVHPRNFPVGKGITSNFAKATAIIRRPSEDVWELIVRRSFSDYCYSWLVDASREYGVSVKV